MLSWLLIVALWSDLSVSLVSGNGTLSFVIDWSGGNSKDWAATSDSVAFVFPQLLVDLESIALRFEPPDFTREQY